jgi:hypothetical protein
MGDSEEEIRRPVWKGDPDDWRLAGLLLGTEWGYQGQRTMFKKAWVDTVSYHSGTVYQPKVSLEGVGAWDCPQVRRLIRNGSLTPVGDGAKAVQMEVGHVE